ncbi:hypothetical protein AVEN_52704-1 [Araneus ventricosus]|uniref:Retrovirus-related Pol polyprotein from transposon TNT 1-94 n=1 Tax=Araneus ventricosus TaxID=182803 RepID=A0A4Y2EN52_ARAVE|nr:hypothetical protein AVEN_52704-1 [Araneus ventricosus]
MPYTPEHNGVIEKENRILVEATRSMIHAQDLPEKLWAEAVNTATYRCCFQDEITPEKTSIEIVQTQSSEEVCEEDASCIDVGEETEIQDIDDLNTSLETKVYNLRNRSQLQKPSRFDGFVMLAERNKPFTFQEGIDSSNVKEWRDAMQEELNSLNEKESWELGNLPQDREPIENRWVYKIKEMLLIKFNVTRLEHKDEEKLQEFLKNLEETFSVRIEPANYFLGLQIQHLDDGSIFIHQENYCRKVQDSFNMSNANPVSVLFDKSLTCLDHSEKLQEDIP